MSKFGAFFKALGAKIGKAVIGFLKSDQVKNLLKTAEGKIVQAVVTEIDTVPELAALGNHERRAEAIKRVEAKFKEAGLTFKESLVRLLLEVIVSFKKSTTS